MADAYIENCCDCNICPSELDGKRLLCTVGTYIGGENTASCTACLPAGTYTIRYCAGAWNYRDGWVVARVPPVASDVGGGRWFIYVLHSNGTATAYFNEPAYTNPLSVGYPTEADAIAAATGMSVTVEHTGGVLGIHFVDNWYDDNFTGPAGTPVFGIYGDDPSVTIPIIARTDAPNPCGSNIADNRYTVRFHLHSNSECSLTGVNVQLLAQGGIINPSSPKTINLPAGGNTYVDFDLSLANPRNKAVTATLRFTQAPLHFPDIEFDLTPNLTIYSTYSTYLPYSCVNAPQQITVGMRVVSGLPLENLYATISGSDIARVQNTSCVDTNPLPIGPVGAGGCGSSVTKQFKLATTSTHPASVTLNFAWKEDDLSLPPSSVTIPLSW